MLVVIKAPAVNNNAFKLGLMPINLFYSKIDYNANFIL